MNAQTRRLAQAIEGFLAEVPHGTPPPVVAGLQNLAKGLRMRPEGQPTPGQQEVANMVGKQEMPVPEDAGLTPGQKAALDA